MSRKTITKLFIIIIVILVIALCLFLVDAARLTQKDTPMFCIVKDEYKIDDTKSVKEYVGLLYKIFVVTKKDGDNTLKQFKYGTIFSNFEK